jgi:hypothetical protein
MCHIDPLVSHCCAGLLLFSSLAFANPPLNLDSNRGQAGDAVKFVTRADAVIYSFTGATGGTAVAVDAAGNAYVTGSTTQGVPTTVGAYQPTFNGGTCFLGTTTAFCSMVLARRSLFTSSVRTDQP